MSNFKLVKTAAALALGASVVTSAVATTDASAASKYKIKSGKLVYAKSGKVVKGYVTYKSTVYKNGSKLTGLKGKTYYKAGKKATGTYKGAYYVKGVKKVTTGTYNKAYYVKGVKKVSTGLYASKYYKDGKLATGTYKGAYYVKGLKKVTTGTYNGAYYVKGKKVVSTGLYADKLYVDGKLNKGYKLYKEDLYKDAVLNTELALFEGKLYDGAKLNEGHKIFKDELYNGSELNTKLALFEGKLYNGAKLNEGIQKFEDKWYNNAELADGTFTVEGVEKAFENGVEVGAKVKSVEAINGSEIKVTFNKSVDKKTVIDTDGSLKDNILTISTDAATPVSVPLDTLNADLSENGKELTIHLTAAINGKYSYNLVKDVVLTKDNSEKFAASVGKFEVSDSVKPTVEKVEAVSKYVFDVTLSESVKSSSLTNIAATLEGVSVLSATNPAFVEGSNNKVIRITLDSSKATANKDITLVLPTITDLAGNNASPITKTVRVSDTDKAAPTVTSAVATSPTTILVTLDEAATLKDPATNLVEFNGAAAAIVKEPGDTTGTKYVVTVPNTTTLGTLTLKATLFTDLAGNSTDKDTTKLVSFAEDKTAPTITKQEVKYVDNTKNELVLTFSEKVTKNTGDLKFTYIDKYGVEKEETVPNAKVEVDSATGKTVTIKLENASAPLALDTKYSVKFDKGFFKDVFGNESAEQTVSFTNTGSASSVIQKLVATIGAATTDTTKGQFITVSFDKTVDPVSATNPANYTVEGASVKEVKLKTNNATSASVEVYVTPETLTITGNYDVTVKNVKGYSENIVANETTTKSVQLKENVAPKLTSTAIKAFAGGKTTVTLNWSEAIATGATATTTTDFDVYVDGVKSTTLTATTNSATEVEIDADLSADIVAGKVITLKPTTTFAFADAAGNKASVSTITVK